MKEFVHIAILIVMILNIPKFIMLLHI